MDLVAFGLELSYVHEFEPIPPIECWPAQLNQVFMNIIVNGCQAIMAKPNQENARGALTVRVFSQNTSVLISFQDTGFGIPKNIIEPFPKDTVQK